jgi:hypothetical protein
MSNEPTLNEQPQISPNKKQNTKDESFVHTAIVNAQKCNHSFKRVRPNQIECTKCGFGFFDSPDEPFVLTK